MTHTPKIFHVNWFRTGEKGEFLWPGFADNMRVLDWILQRCEGKVGARETPIGWIPSASDLDLSGLDINAGVMDQLLAVDREDWKQDVEGVSEFFKQFGDKLPKQMHDELATLKKRLG